jgi:PAS domain S-box-containing protein
MRMTRLEGSRERSREGTAGPWAGSGETRELGRACAWAASPLGPVDEWPAALEAALAVVLDTPVPMCLYAGPEFVTLYNDAYRTILGAKHPAAFGRPAAEVWAELWPEIGPQFRAVREGGSSVKLHDVPFRIERSADGAAEMAWFDYSLSPVRGLGTHDGGHPAVAILSVGAETTTRVQAERALRAEREHLRAVILCAPAPMALHVGPSHLYELVNDAYKRISAGGRDVTGLTVREAFPELEGQGIFEVFDRVYATGEGWGALEVPVRYDRDGTGLQDTWFNLRIEPLRDADGRVAGVVNFSFDVTDETRARHEVERLLAGSEQARAAAEHNAQQLEEQAAELEMLAEEVQATAALLEERTEEAEAERARAAGILEATSDAYFALDPDYRVVAVNAAMTAGTELTRDALLGGLYWELFPAASGTAIERHFRAAATEGIPAHFEHDYSDGRLDLVASVDVYPADAGGIVVFWRDVTDRARIAAERERLLAAERSARAAADEARTRTEAVLASIADAFYLLDREWRFTYVNEAAEPLLQTSSGELLGRTLWEAFPGVTGSVFEGAYREAMTRGHVTSVEAYFDPLATWLDVRIYPWTGGMMVHFRDIGARKRAEAERERLLTDAEAARTDAELARAQAEAANQAKSQFLAVMSHELRTPLNAIGGYAELIEMAIYGPVTEAQHDALTRIQASQRHLLGLIAGVLDYSRIEAGAVAYRLMDVSVVEAVLEAETLVAPQLRANGLGYSWDGAAPGLMVRADPEKLQQILLNLLSNAVKFTTARNEVQGRIEVACTVEDGAPDDAGGTSGRIHLRIRDTGDGIPADKLEMVFEPFVQVDQRLTRSHEGAGLGLAISRDLARGMGGELNAESTIGVGSTFTLTLPRSRQR